MLKPENLDFIKHCAVSLTKFPLMKISPFFPDVVNSDGLLTVLMNLYRVWNQNWRRRLHLWDVLRFMWKSLASMACQGIISFWSSVPLRNLHCNARDFNYLGYLMNFVVFNFSFVALWNKFLISIFLIRYLTVQFVRFFWKRESNQKAKILRVNSIFFSFCVILQIFVDKNSIPLK